MKPASFAYVAARSIDDALDVLSENGDDAKVIAGGQSLGPLLNLRLAFADLLVDINPIEGLDFVRRTDGGELSIGALTRHRSMEFSPLVAAEWPVLTSAVGEIGHRAIRNRGTIGGSVAHADPAAELPATFISLNATFHVVSVRGKRSIAARDFFLGPFTTVLQPDELLVEIRVPRREGRSAQTWMEFSRRSGDFGIVGVVANLEFDRRGRCATGSLVYSGVGSTPWEFERGADLLRKVHLSSELTKEIGEAAARECTPPADDLATSAFRKRLVGVLTTRALAQCIEEAGLKEDSSW